MPHAWTLIRTHPACGSGISRSTISNGPFGLETCTARIFFPITFLSYSSSEKQGAQAWTRGRTGKVRNQTGDKRARRIAPEMSHLLDIVWQRFDDNCHCCQPLAREDRAMNKRTNTMNRTKSLRTAAEFGLMAAIALSVIGELSASSGPVEATSGSDGNKPAVKANPLKPPVQGRIPVDF